MVLVGLTVRGKKQFLKLDVDRLSMDGMVELGRSVKCL